MEQILLLSVLVMFSRRFFLQGGTAFATTLLARQATASNKASTSEPSRQEPAAKIESPSGTDRCKI